MTGKRMSDEESEELYIKIKVTMQLFSPILIGTNFLIKLKVSYLIGKTGKCISNEN